jgi:hypothetical protein
MPWCIVVQVFVDVSSETTAVAKVKVADLPVNMLAITQNTMRVACNNAPKHATVQLLAREMLMKCG